MEKNAKENIVIGNLVFIILVLIVVVGLFAFINRAGTQAPLYEQAYAKRIAVAINNARPGMEVEIDLTDPYQISSRNRFNGKIVEIDNLENSVHVQLGRGDGYSYRYFNNVDVVWDIEDNSFLILKIHEAQNG